jgi:chemotaxis regulatin CheY-phosphate phosphatase CheZ
MTDTDYETILSAVLETARGRWFLAEHMRRNRQADTKLVLKAIGQLERGLRERPSALGAERMRLELVDMANAISRTKSEIASIKPAGRGAGKIGFATNELDAIVETTEKATSEILAAIERIQEIAWMLREQGTDPAVCDLLDAQATEAYTACSFQDLTGQRIRRVIDVMRFLEARIDAMIRIWRLSDADAPEAKAAAEDPLLHGPAPAGEGLGQSEIDDLIAIDRSDDIGWREAAPAAEGEIAREIAADLELDGAGIVPAESPAPSAIPRAEDAVPALVVPPAPPAPSKLSTRLREAIEALSPAERMALFS